MTPEPASDHTHLADNGKAKLTLDELAGIQPGMARLMVEVSDRMWKCYHAGRARNRPLARYQLSEATKILKAAAVVRPKYAESMQQFIGEEMASLRAAVEGEEWGRLEEVFAEVVSATNRYHDQFDKGFIVWKVPAEPPSDLDLSPSE
ncbi:MAG: hypothetical protein ACYDGN_15265 [Acidimicrobiales bacterium]